METAPAIFWAWGTGKQYLNLTQMLQPSRMLCFAARRLDKRKTEFYSEWEHGQNGMAEQVHRILDEADAVLHYNGASFDVPWLRTVMKTAGLNPPSPFRQIDLYQQTKQFRLDSHKLQHVSTHLSKLDGKVETGGFGLWQRVIDGDEKARRLFKKYNVQDVDLLLEMFEDLKPWLKLPNANLYGDGTRVCPKCGVDAIQHRGFYRLTTGNYKRYWCNPQRNGCGGWSRDTRREPDSATVVQV